MAIKSYIWFKGMILRNGPFGSLWWGLGCLEPYKTNLRFKGMTLRNGPFESLWWGLGDGSSESYHYKSYIIWV